jgi:iron(III) transport system ATP-binding protein
MNQTKDQLIIDKVSKVYGGIIAVQNLCIAFNLGSVHYINGPSGGGKTTLLRLIAGLEKPDSGTIWMNGEEVVNSKWSLQPHCRRIGCVCQSTALWPHLTVYENIAFGLHAISKTEQKARINSLLLQAGLLNRLRDYPNQLSGGEARRVAICRALAPKPILLLMDEPLVNLDPHIKQTMMTLIYTEMESTQATLLYVTHDMDEFISANSKFYHMHQGVLHPCALKSQNDQIISTSFNQQ